MSNDTKGLISPDQLEDHLDSMRFEISAEMVKRLRDAAVEAALDADVKKQKYEFALIWQVRNDISEILGSAWEQSEGVIEFTDGDESVQLMGLVRPGYFEREPLVRYRRKLKSGKYSKEVPTHPVSYIAKFFRRATKSE